MKKIGLGGFFSILILLLISPVFALSVLDLTTEQLTQRADLIVVGQVLSAYSEKASSDRDVFTYISVRVDGCLKGLNPSGKVVLKTVGGVIGDQTIYVPGAADFHRNEEVLLFLERRDDGSFLPIGMSLGKFSIYRDPDTQQKIVLRESDGSGRYFDSPRSEEWEGLLPREKVFLNEFVSRIGRIVETGRQK